MAGSKGFILISVIFFLGVAVLLGAFLVRLMVAEFNIASDDELQLKAFWAAEGGVEWGKAKLAENPAWFTDLAHSPNDDTIWLIKDASGCRVTIADVHAKIIREEGKNTVYSVGYVGNDVSGARAMSIVKIQFQVNPFEQISWAAL